MKFTFPFFKENKENSVFLSFDKHRNNLGDILSPVTAEHFGSKKVIRISKRKCKSTDHYFMIGSILQRCTKHSVIWGSGIISEESVCREKPKKVLAVRGPLTRKRLLEQNIDCPEIYGDPALLLPEIYPRNNSKPDYKLGIIPHFLNKNDPLLKKFTDQPGINIINTQTKDPFKAIDDILNCEKIISSSLHGLIIPDAYGIPSTWTQFTKPIEHDYFKFHDYFASVGRNDEKPFIFSDFKSLDEMLQSFEDYTIRIDLEKLKDSFPF